MLSRAVTHRHFAIYFVLPDTVTVFQAWLKLDYWATTPLSSSSMCCSAHCICTILSAYNANKYTKWNAKISRDGKVKKYTNKSSRDNNRHDVSLHVLFHKNPVAWNIRCRTGADPGSQVRGGGVPKVNNCVQSHMPTLMKLCPQNCCEQDKQPEKSMELDFFTLQIFS